MPRKPLTRATGLLDFVLTSNGDYVFLEIDPSGQFLFNEIDTGDEQAFAQMLLCDDSLLEGEAATSFRKR